MMQSKVDKWTGGHRFVETCPLTRQLGPPYGSQAVMGHPNCEFRVPSFFLRILCPIPPAILYFATLHSASQH